MESTGEKLKKIRQELGLSLEEAQKKTKIHLNILKAIEGDSLSGLSPVYLKGFLKIYCKFLRVDPKDYMPDYKETGAHITNVIATKDVSEKPKIYTMFLNSVRPSKKFKTAFVYILIIILLALGLFNLGKAVSSNRKKHSTQEKLLRNIPVKTESKKKPSLQKAAVSNLASREDKPQKEIASGIRLAIRARENCWVNLKVDGRVVFQRVLEKGRSENWQAKDRIELSLGNAGSVELEVNGQQFLSLGRRGQVLKNILITKEGLKVGR